MCSFFLQQIHNFSTYFSPFHLDLIDEVWKLLFFLQGAMYAKRKSLCHQSLSKTFKVTQPEQFQPTMNRWEKRFWIMSTRTSHACQSCPRCCSAASGPLALTAAWTFQIHFFRRCQPWIKTYIHKAIRNLTGLSCGWKQSFRNLKSAQQRIFLENSEIFVKNGRSLCSHSLRTPRHSAWHAEFYRDLLEDGLLRTCCHAKVGFFTEPWNSSKSLRSMKGFEIPFTTPVSSSLQGTQCDHLLAGCAQCQAVSLLGLHLCTGKQLCSKSPLLPLAQKLATSANAFLNS